MVRSATDFELFVRGADDIDEKTIEQATNTSKLPFLAGHDLVMEAQKDLVKIDHTLHQILNYKGEESPRKGRRK